MIEKILISFSLAMDAFAVSISKGLTTKKQKILNGLRISVCFGFFQFIMPVIGWFIGSSLKGFISSFDHWIAFVLLSAIGGKMIYESFQDEEDEKGEIVNLKTLIFLGIATSIDALIVGVAFSVTDGTIWSLAILIGIITFAMSFIGFNLGNKFGKHLGSKAEIIGGVVLIGIGVKVLVEHVF